MKVLMQQSSSGSHSVVLPRVVLDEVTHKYRVDFATAVQDIERRIESLARLRPDMEDYEPIWYDDQILTSPDYGHWLATQIAASHIEIVETPEETLTRLLQRAVAKRRPFKAQDAGFRDAVIWETVLDHLRRASPTSSAALVSGDIKAFGEGDVLDTSLAREVASTGHRLDLFRSVQAYVVAHITEDPKLHARIADLVHTERDQLITNIEQAVLGRVLDLHAAFGEGEIVGLDRDTVHIEVETVGPVEDRPEAVVVLRLTVDLVIDVDGFNPDTDDYLFGRHVVHRTVPFTATWDPHEEELAAMTAGEIDDLSVSGMWLE